MMQRTVRSRGVWAVVVGVVLAGVLVTPSVANHTAAHTQDQFDQQAKRLTNQSQRIRNQRDDIVDHRDRLLVLEGNKLRSGTTIQGLWGAAIVATAAGHNLIDAWSFGVALPSGLTVHHIANGAAVPPGCSGSASNPGADPGHFCIFEGPLSAVLNATFNCVYDPSTFLCVTTTTSYGSGVIYDADAAGPAQAGGSWALTVP